ncbi:MAG: DNA topoisomerase IV subunit A [Lactobacillales bacterium]|jgi:topoisomerase-4 subunit A|nr:DNA topoisomerase IV subunit A [Lactobacillales bacterium]
MSRGEIQELTLENVMGDRFGRYSKYIIQERALPDIRDGLKPVQRRILFSMNKDNNTYDKGFRKSAKSVGNVMGNFHPHGDSSIYEAMVRMSQDWKLREVLIEMHGNNGSRDYDPPAAMRYTEARLSQVAGEMLRDIDKETVEFVLNFDDTEKEPAVLPAKFPNLLVNGSTGISAGYATEIPTHNLAEVIDGVIFLIDHPKEALSEVMKLIPGPDFPTGAILQGKDEIQKAYETGRGKVILRSKTQIKDIKGGKQQIVINEIPYEVNKATLVKRIDEIRINKKIDGIAEVRDESDRAGLQIVVELKREANAQGILNYLFKHTELQINYNFNMVAIVAGHPRQVGLLTILHNYIAHRKDILTKRSRFALNKAQKRQHIVDGLIKALSILDQVIAKIRVSNDRKDAKQNLIDAFGFTNEQAEAIVVLQLYRLTNTDITELQKEAEELGVKITDLLLILNDEKKLFSLMKKELRKVKKQFGNSRLTVIEEKVSEIKIETEILIASEEVMLSVTHDGYIKRSSLRSYQASKGEEVGLKDKDYVVYQSQVNTLDHVLLVTSLGNVIYRLIHELPELKWKEVGDHLSQTISTLSSEEAILKVIPFKELDEKLHLLLITKNGMIKQTKLTEFAPWRTYKTRPIPAIKLKNDDCVQNIELVEAESNKEVLLVSHRGFGLRFALSEVPVVGTKAAGVKSMNLKQNDFVVNGIVTNLDDEEAITIVTQRGALKRMLVSKLSILTRAKRGVMVLRELKSNPHRIIYIGQSTSAELLLTTDKGREIKIVQKVYPIGERTSNGSFVIDEKIETVASVRISYDQITKL